MTIPATATRHCGPPFKKSTFLDEWSWRPLAAITTNEKSAHRRETSNCQRANLRPILRWSFKPVDECGQDELWNHELSSSHNADEHA